MRETALEWLAIAADERYGSAVIQLDHGGEGTGVVRFRPPLGLTFVISSGEYAEKGGGDIAGAIDAKTDQVRSTAVDLIRGWGLGREEAERLVREATVRLATDEHAVPTHSSPRGS
jgi:hypothetical protein